MSEPVLRVDGLRVAFDHPLGPVYEALGAKEKLAAIYPDCKHDFPPEARKAAYEWLDRWLK